MQTVTGIAKFTLGGMWKFEMAYRATVDGDKVVDMEEGNVYRFDYPIHASASAEGEYWEAFERAVAEDVARQAGI